MKRMPRKAKAPPRRDARITSQYVPADGSIVISVARGWTGSGEILYRLEAEKLAGAIEDRKELAVIVNNLGLLVLAQLTGFNLAENLDQLPKALARWAHIDVDSLRTADMADILAIAQKTVHGTHGHSCDPDADRDDACRCRCDCTGTPDQMICAQYCGLCRKAQDEAGSTSGDGTSGSDETSGPAPGAGGGGDSGGAAASSPLATNE